MVEIKADRFSVRGTDCAVADGDVTVYASGDAVVEAHGHVTVIASDRVTLVVYNGGVNCVIRSRMVKVIKQVRGKDIAGVAWMSNSCEDAGTSY